MKYLIAALVVCLAGLAMVSIGEGQEATPTPTPWHQPRDNYWCPPPEDADPLWRWICERMENLEACWCLSEDECYCGQETPASTPSPTPSPTPEPISYPTPSPTPSPTATPCLMPIALPQTGGVP